MIDLKKKLSLFIIILLIFSAFPSFLGLGEDNGPTWEETKAKLERLFAEPKWRNLDKQIIEMVEYPQDPNWASKVREKIGKTAFSDLSEKKKEQKIVELITGRRGRDRIKTTDGSVLNGSLIVKSFQIKMPYLEEPKDVALKYIDDIELKRARMWL